jgi:N-hydroxyarylamine O-acetyltransferase
MQLRSYLARLGINDHLAPTAETLRQLHVAHLRAFPFHNLTIQRRAPVDLALPEIERRFMEAGGGGYCFEHNTLFGTALRELGFPVTTLLGRVGPPEWRALNHMLLRVEADGESWLADVGFGGDGPLEPLRLREGMHADQHGVAYSLRREEDHWILTMHCGGVAEDLYEFSGLPHTRGDVEMANHFTATHPASIFRRTMSIQRVTEEERVILRPRVIIRIRDGVRTEVPIEPADLRKHARELFGIELGEEKLLFEE